MGDRGTLIAADIAHARLQQRLGDGEDALAAEGLAGAKPQRFDFFAERAFHNRTGALLAADIAGLGKPPQTRGSGFVSAPAPARVPPAAPAKRRRGPWRQVWIGKARSSSKA